jgi:hypothetical protein
MSLINDALKRARQAQPPPTLAGPPMTPATHQRPAQWPILVVPLLLIGVVAVATWFFWYAAKTSRQAMANPPATRVAARENPQPRVTAPSLPYAGALARSIDVAQQVSNLHGGAAAAFPSAAVTGGGVPNQPNTTAAPPATDALAVEPPKPAPLRLRAIFYRPDNPSAMINTKTLFLGDKIGDSRVIDIGRESVTLLCKGQTNVLTLE